MLISDSAGARYIDLRLPRWNICQRLVWGQSNNLCSLECSNLTRWCRLTHCLMHSYTWPVNPRWVSGMILNSARIVISLQYNLVTTESLSKFHSAVDHEELPSSQPTEAIGFASVAECGAVHCQYRVYLWQFVISAWNRHVRRLSRSNLVYCLIAD